MPRDWETQPHVSLWEAACCGQWAEWGLVEHSWQKQCDRPASTRLCRGSRWPGCREGVGRPIRGRGVGEETEKAKGWGWSLWLARRLFNEYNVLGTLMSCVHSWRAASRIGELARLWGGGTGDGSQVGELPGCWAGRPLTGWWGSLCPRFKEPSFFLHFKVKARPC